MSVSVSAIIITKNEEHNIRECLASISWVDEIIVVDSGSTDQTLDIAASFNAKMIKTTEWPGFGLQKGKALSHATCEWVLSIDADERVSEALKQEILQFIHSNTKHAAYVPRSSFFCGQRIKYSGWSPDYVLRIFKREVGRFSEDVVHERVLVDVPAAYLKNPLDHYSYQSMDDVVKKIKAYGEAGSFKIIQKKKKINRFTPCYRSAWMWFRTFILKRGFLDGQAGMRIANMNAQTTYIKYFNAYQYASKGRELGKRSRGKTKI